MKVLLLHQHFNTPDKGGALRSYFLAKALVSAHIDTVVITAHNNPQYLQKNIEGIEVHFIPVPYHNEYGFYKRIKAFLLFVVRSVNMSMKLQHVDLCYAISTPLTVGVSALFIKWTKNIPYIFEVGDLWPDAPVQLGFIKNPILRFLLYQFEKLVYRESKSVVALSPAMKEIIVNKSSATIVHLIPNMADMDFYKPEIKRKELENKFETNNHFVISYIGSVGYANGLDFFIDCARACQKEKLPVLFLLCGDGALLPYLVDTAKNLSVDNLKFIPFQNREGVKDVLSVTDAIFVCYRKAKILETGSPNKYFDGLAAGKMIITNFGGWIKKDIEHGQCGFGVTSNNPDEFVKNISTYLGDENSIVHTQQNARKLAEKYSREKLSKKFVDLINTTINSILSQQGD